MADLHVYKNKVTDWVVAESVEHAQQLLTEYLQSMGSDGPDEFGLAFEQEPDDKVMTITCEDENEQMQKQTKTCAEWAASEGPGFLASTE